MAAMPAPTWIPAEDMRAIILDLVNEIEQTHENGGLYRNGGNIHFEPTGATLTPPNSEVQDAMIRLADAFGVTHQTPDWVEVVLSVLGHIALWCDTGRLLDAYGQVVPLEDRLVLCPETLERRSREFFGEEPTYHSVTAEQIRTLFKEVPVMSLRPGAWMTRASVRSWTNTWRVRRLVDARIAELM